MYRLYIEWYTLYIDRRLSVFQFPPWKLFVSPVETNCLMIIRN